jgi:hypothetical protein
MQNVMNSIYIDGFTVNTTTQDICNCQDKNEKIWQLYLAPNMANSNCYCICRRPGTNKATKLTHHSGGWDCESSAQRRKIARICGLCKAYTGQREWKAIGDRLQAPSYLTRFNHHWKKRARKQRTDTGKYCFVNRSITDWNQLPEGAKGTSHGETHIFKMRVRKG